MTSAVATQFLPVVAAAGAAQNLVVVSLHDVAPSSQAVAEKIISELSHRGVRICSLLVVPDYHHQGPAMKDRKFVSWLRDLELAGHEIVIHGYFHERPRGCDETWSERFLTRFYTNDEGEFYDIGYEEAFRRIITARDEFRTNGLTPRGFVAPAWLLSKEGERATRDAELEYTTRLRTVRDLRSGKDFPARSLVYSVRSNWRRSLSLIWNSALSQLMKNAPLVRLSIHPPDYSYPAIWRQIVDLIDAMDGLRTPTTYRDWIAEQRSTTARAD
jgi:predicted deacetylase